LITTYEIRNVLRVYGNQLKKRSIRLEESVGLPYTPVDMVDISIDARRRQMLSQMSNQLISQVVPMAYERNLGEHPRSTDLTQEPLDGMAESKDYQEELT
jgi:hypothetical protein